MKLKILQAGRYNDREHKAARLRAGDELETTEGYGQSLLDAGLAERVVQLAEAENSQPVAESPDSEVDQIGPVEPATVLPPPLSEKEKRAAAAAAKKAEAAAKRTAAAKKVAAK